VRGYFGLHDNDKVVWVTSTEDFVVHFWARNVETFASGVQVTTPASQFRGAGSSGRLDALVMDVPPHTGISLGCIGGKGGEKFEITATGRVTVFLTVETAPGATVTMARA
jgi:hypothetical protein